MEYQWRIRACYRRGRYQAWACRDEAAAGVEYAQLLAEQATGEYEDLSAIVLERRPIPPWEPVQSRSFGDRGGPS